MKKLRFVKDRNRIKVYGRAVDILFRVARFRCLGIINYSNTFQKYAFQPGLFIVNWGEDILAEIAIKLSDLNETKQCCKMKNHRCK